MLLPKHRQSIYMIKHVLAPDPAKLLLFFKLFFFVPLLNRIKDNKKRVNQYSVLNIWKKKSEKTSFKEKAKTTKVKRNS